MTQQPSEAEKFKDVARKHGEDEDEAAWDKRLKKVVKHQPVEKPERSDAR